MKIIDEIVIEEPLIIEIGKLADKYNFEVYIVGGYIRDYFLKIPRSDFDFTVVGDALKFAEYVAEHYNTKAVLYGLYRTAMVPVCKYKVEFVGTRKEEYLSNSRKPIVTVGTLEDDLRRRDFTINAIAASINKDSFGKIIDIFDGVNDIKKQIIRTPLDADVTFSDDPLRIFRAARFASKLGFKLNRDIILTAKKLSDRINILSKERITDEFMKILASPKPSVGLKILFEMEILQKILPELTNLSSVEYVEHDGKSYYHKENFFHSLDVIDSVSERTENLWLRLAALLHDIGKTVTKEFVEGKGWTFHNHPKIGAEMLPAIFKRMRMPIQALDYVAKIVLMHHRPLTLNYDNISDAPFRRLAVDAGDILDDLLILSGCDVSTKNTEDAENHFRKYEIVKQRVLDILVNDKLKDFHSPVNGNEIIELCNIPPSKIVGIIKNRIEDAIIEGIIPNEYESARNYLLENKDKWLSVNLKV
jgi:putative nucleotidyltransferase with HDIG domain